MGHTPDERLTIADAWLRATEPLVKRRADASTWHAIWTCGVLVLLVGGGYWLLRGSSDGLVCGAVGWVLVALIAMASRTNDWYVLAQSVERAARAGEPGPFLHEAGQALVRVWRLDEGPTRLPDRMGALFLRIAPPGIPASSRQALEYLSRYSEEWAAWRAEHGLPPGVEDIDDLEDEQVALCVEAERDGRLPPGLRQIREALQADAKGLRR